MKSLKPEEVFEYLDDRFDFIAMDETAEWYAYREKPEQENFTWNAYDPEILPLNIDYTGDWKDSLHCRKELKSQEKINDAKDRYECPCCGVMVNKDKCYLSNYICFHCYRLTVLPVDFEKNAKKGLYKFNENTGSMEECK